MNGPALGRVLAPAWLAVLAAGCAGVDPQPVFDSLRVDLAARSGIEASWPQGPEASAAADEELRRLLASELDQESAARIALLRNRELLAGLEELGIGQAELAQAARIANPKLELSRRRLEGGGGSQVEVGFAIDLLDGLIAPRRRKLAAIELEALRLRTARLLQTTVADTRIAVVELQATLKKLEAMILLRDLDASAAEIAKRQHAAGNVNDRDLARHELRANQSQVALTQARLEARQAREALQRQLGLSGPELGWKLAAGFPQRSAREISGEGLEQLAEEQRYDLAAARAGLDLVGRALALKKGMRYFPLGVEVGVSTEKEPDGTRLTGPTLVLELPIFDTGKASIAKLEAEERKARRQLEGLQLEVRSQVREAWDALRAARQLADFHQRVLLPQQAFLVDQTLRHHNMMLEGVYELIEARKEEAEEQISAAESERDYWIARARLELALGGRLPAPPAPEAAEGGKP
jgi:outer membrane protein, heavy metal efflux system